uniref:Uncharacterized protein n=1 Tax=Anguilla anguilla TaxID=7936 RepID=A0A0E9VDX5_ANGAN
MEPIMLIDVAYLLLSIQVIYKLCTTCVLNSKQVHRF